jgi:hypothetical protein
MDGRGHAVVRRVGPPGSYSQAPPSARRTGSPFSTSAAQAGQKAPFGGESEDSYGVRLPPLLGGGAAASARGAEVPRRAAAPSGPRSVPLGLGGIRIMSGGRIPRAHVGTGGQQPRGRQASPAESEDESEDSSDDSLSGQPPRAAQRAGMLKPTAACCHVQPWEYQRIGPWYVINTQRARRWRGRKGSAARWVNADSYHLIMATISSTETSAIPC